MADGTAPIERVTAAAYTVPTEAPESDGTLVWRSTTLVVVHIEAGGQRGLGYTYADTATATLVRDRLGPLLTGRDALATAARRHELHVALRNLGTSGIGAMALSALDVALWDVKARCLDTSLVTLLGRARETIAAYASGGFTSQSPAELREVLGRWAQAGFTEVKMKVGREPEQDARRVAAAREAVGPAVSLFVDANGAYTVKEALGWARRFAGFDVRWLEEPVTSDDIPGLRLLREQGPPRMAIAAGEYGWRLDDFRRLLEAGAVDVLQADATRCGGVSGFLGAAALAEAYHVPLSSHCAPALHVPLMCAAVPAAHLEHFHDHVGIEERLFDGTPRPTGGRLAPDATRPGLGLEFKERDARCFMD